MKLKNLLKQKREIITVENKHFGAVVYDLVEAIESNSNWPWCLSLNSTYKYPEDEVFSNSVGIKDLSTINFGSDEDSINRILVFKGEDIAYLTKTGDTRTWGFQFYDKGKMDNFLAFLMEVELRVNNEVDLEYAIISEKDLEEDVGDQYLSFNEFNDEVYLSINNDFAPWVLKNSIPNDIYLKEHDQMNKYPVVKWATAFPKKDSSLVIDKNGVETIVFSKDIYIKPQFKD